MGLAKHTPMSDWGLTPPLIVQYCGSGSLVMGRARIIREDPALSFPTRTISSSWSGEAERYDTADTPFRLRGDIFSLTFGISQDQI
jgi:hypothetical protein